MLPIDLNKALMTPRLTGRDRQALLDARGSGELFLEGIVWAAPSAL